VNLKTNHIVKLPGFLFGLLLALGSSAPGEAASLSQRIGTILGPNGIVLEVNPSDPVFMHTAHFTSSTLSTLGLMVEQLAPSAADFPAISTVPGFTYRYDPGLDEFERTSTSMGPIFVERARTIGKGIFDVGAAYSYINFDQLDGKDLDGLSLVLGHGESQVFFDETATVKFNEFSLESHVLSLFATYGLTEKWDINVLLPIVHTTMDINGNAHLDNVVTSITTPGGTVIEGPFHFFDEALGIVDKAFSVSDEKTGVGDILVRTKYHLVEHEGYNVASGVVLRLPTGDEDNFQGLGSATLNVLVAGSWEDSVLHLHGTLGFDINLDEADRSRVRYAGGATFQILDSLAFSADLIGSSNLKSYEVSIEVPTFGDDSFNTDPPMPSGYVTVSDRIRTDILDLSLGIKVSFSDTVVGFANVLLPVNDDGLRASVVPTAGLEITF